MKRQIFAGLLIGSALSFSALASDVGVSVSIGQPGFYGRLDIGGYPAPALLYPQPVMIQPAPAYGPPVYLRVPPGHAKHWRRYCDRYGACGERVYFVRDEWYRQVYAPRYREYGAGPDWRGGPGEPRGREERGWDRGERGGFERGEGGRGGHGHGHGHGH